MAGKKILLVEGPDDEHVLKHICGQRNVGTLDAIISQDGVNNLLDVLPVRLKESGIDVLGIVFDADADIRGRWESLRNRLQSAGYDAVPEKPTLDGTILQPPVNTLLPRFGVWLMPDNQNAGILEDFLRFLVPPGSKLFEHVESSVDFIPENERRFSPLAKPKAVIHTWLAWQEEPGKPLGTAITARYLDPTVPQASVLADWLKRLYFP